jgi:isopentenyl-diphosphate delta-isomerase
VRELVTLVDRDDNVLGVEEKLRAHRDGKLHRAFSVFVFDAHRNLLIQRRARSKYHSGGLWSNTCCGHPRPGEAAALAAARRLAEEMGFVCELHYAFRVLYQADLGNSMIEHELDQVFVGRFDGPPAPSPGEVEECRWLPVEHLRRQLDQTPTNYTTWLDLLLKSTDWPVVDRILDLTDIQPARSGVNS